MRIGIVGDNNRLTQTELEQWKTELKEEADVFDLDLDFKVTPNGDGTFAVVATARAKE